MTTRERIAAAYDNSAWVRLAAIAVILAVSWAGMGLLIALDPSPWLGGTLTIAWVLAVACAGAWYVAPIIGMERRS